MEILKVVAIFNGFIALSCALTPPPWYIIVGGTWDYVDWCKNPDCTRLLNDHIDSSEMHSSKDLAAWSVCKIFFGKMEKSILRDKHRLWNTTEAVHNLIKSQDFCDFQKIEEEWERENYHGFIHPFYDTPSTTTPVNIDYLPTTTDHPVTKHDGHWDVVPHSSTGTPKTSNMSFRPCEEWSTAPWIVTIVALVVTLLASLSLSGYLYYVLRKMQSDYQNDTLLSQF